VIATTLKHLKWNGEGWPSSQVRYRNHQTEKGTLIMLKLFGVALLCASFYLWQHKPIDLPVLGGCLGAKFFLGRLVAITVFIGGLLAILVG
jgi:hypothetical protein